jgi:hypothetical protein
MASVIPKNIVKNDWMLANPWLWLGAGFILAIWSWLWTFLLGDIANDNRVIVLALGLLCGAAGVWLRWHNRATYYLNDWRSPLALMMGLGFFLLGVGVSALFVVSYFIENLHNFKPGPMFLVWITTAPLSFFAARACLNRGPDAEESKQIADREVGLAFVLAAGICLVGSFTLYIDSEHRSDWDTLRMFLRVLTAVSLFAAALMLVTTAVRRLMLSLLFTLHFAGIATAALAAPPSPWIIQQTWMRFFRPYLQFVYLNNAYHYYAPEPGPASYLWFRIIFESPDGKSDEGIWYKIPQLDEAGRIQHPVALEYQRFLSLTEAVAQPGGYLPPEVIFNSETKEWEVNPFYAKRRQLASPDPEPVKVGAQQTNQLRIPGHNTIPMLQQVWIPNDGSSRLLSSYARFLGRKFAVHPDKPGWEFKSVKIYKVTHWIPPVRWFLEEIPPTDPDTYLPYYAGNYKADGKIKVEPDDPYLYWLLPSIRDRQNDPDSQIRDYARRHAGDPNWIRRGSDRRWVKSGEEDMESR